MEIPWRNPTHGLQKRTKFLHMKSSKYKRTADDDNDFGNDDDGGACAEYTEIYILIYRRKKSKESII